MPNRSVKRILVLLGLCGVLAGAGNSSARADGMVTIQATMILASNDRAPMDSRLETIEYKLRRVFGFEYYRHYGEASVSLSLPSQTTMDLGHGFSLVVNATGSHDGKIRAGVMWLRGAETVLNTTVSMNRNTPVILGGVQHENGTLIVSLTAR